MIVWLQTQVLRKHLFWELLYMIWECDMSFLYMLQGDPNPPGLLGSNFRC